MNGRAYYNEFDEKKAEWLRHLIKAGAIAPGHVDTRSIRAVQPGDLDGFTQCHFFAGIGVWSYALRNAGWPDDRPVWTGSCPCQPFSVAGKRKAHSDDRHLWPELFRLIRERRPERFLGEQVASKDGLAWLDTVLSDLEGAAYTAGAVDLCAAGVGAPHIRQRLWIVANAMHTERRAVNGHRQDGRDRSHSGWEEAHGLAGACSEIRGLANTASQRHDGRRAGEAGRGPQQSERSRDAGELGDTAEARSLPGTHPGIHRGEESRGPRHAEPERSGGPVGVTHGDTERPRLEGLAGHVHNRSGWAEQARPIAPAGVTGGFWRGAELIPCTDGKWRPVEPGTFPLAHGAPARVGRLRGYGDAIAAPLAEEFIKVVMENFA